MGAERTFRVTFFVWAVACILLLPAVGGTVERAKIDQVIQEMMKAVREKNDGIRNRKFFEVQDFGREAEVPLMEAYKANEDLAVRQYIVKTIGWVGGEKTIEFLSGILKEEKESLLRRTAASSLGTLGDKAGVPILIEALKDNDEMVRLSAAVSVGLIEDTRALPALKEALKKSGDIEKTFIKDAIEKLER